MNARLLRPKASGAAFDPRTIAGLEAWWDASDASTVTLNSGNVSQWRDKSGKGVNLTQGTAADQPAYSTSTNTINGRNTITYSPVGDRLINTAVTVTQPVIFSVFRVRSGYSISAANAPIVFDSFSSANDRHVHTFLENSTSTILYSRSSANAANRASITTGSFGTVFVTTCESLATGHNIYVNGSVGTAATAGTNGLTGISVGNLRGNPSPIDANYTFDGQICELLIYSSAFSAAQRQTVERWLGARWGVTVA
jgi:hypothetical protein